MREVTITMVVAIDDEELDSFGYPTAEFEHALMRRTRERTDEWIGRGGVVRSIEMSQEDA